MTIIVNGSEQLSVPLPYPFMPLADCVPLLPSYLHHCYFYGYDEEDNLIPLHGGMIVANFMTLAAYGFTQPA